LEAVAIEDLGEPAAIIAEALGVECLNFVQRRRVNLHLISLKHLRNEWNGTCTTTCLPMEGSNLGTSLQGVFIFAGQGKILGHRMNNISTVSLKHFFLPEKASLICLLQRTLLC
jgi:hypothetical protein